MRARKESNEKRSGKPAGCETWIFPRTLFVGNTLSIKRDTDFQGVEEGRGREQKKKKEKKKKYGMPVVTTFGMDTDSRLDHINTYQSPETSKIRKFEPLSGSLGSDACTLGSNQYRLGRSFVEMLRPRGWTALGAAV
jgi:hypothetical protein